MLLAYLILLLTFQLVQKRNVCVLSEKLKRKKEIIRNCAVCDMQVEIPMQKWIQVI